MLLLPEIQALQQMAYVFNNLILSIQVPVTHWPMAALNSFIGETIKTVKKGWSNDTLIENNEQNHLGTVYSNKNNY